MLPTPSTSHVDYDLVYEPAEDSFLLIDTLSSQAESEWLSQHFDTIPDKSTLVLLEIGPGSGVIIAFLAAHANSIFGRDALSMSIDINPYAATATRTTVEKAQIENGKDEGTAQSIYLSSLLGDLSSALRPGQIDVLIFNPPYVPTESAPSIAFPTDTTASSLSKQDKFSESSHLLSLSYAGGRDGMEITNRLLTQIPEILSQRGVAYILLCQGNKPEEVMQRIRGWDGGWDVEIVGRSGKQAGWEKLCILRIWRRRTEEEGRSEMRI
jgi:release factor glutamine methyltransferase